MISKLTLNPTLDSDRGILNAEVREDLKGEALRFLLNKGVEVKKAPVKFSQEKI